MTAYTHRHVYEVTFDADNNGDDSFSFINIVKLFGAGRCNVVAKRTSCERIVPEVVVGQVWAYREVLDEEVTIVNIDGLHALVRHGDGTCMTWFISSIIAEMDLVE